MSAQEIVAQNWKEHSPIPFSAYALRSGDSQADVVEGTLYELSLPNALMLSDWDFTSIDNGVAWRFWDLAVGLTDGRQVMTLTIDSEQAVDRTVSGIGYDPFLNDRGATMQVIRDFHQNR